MQRYQILDKKDRRKLAELLSGESAVLVPVLGLIETALRKTRRWPKPCWKTWWIGV